MPINPEWREAVREAFAGRRQVDVAEVTGISQPWVNMIANGRIPTRETLALLCDRLAVGADLRARLFRLAGQVDPAAPDSPSPAEALLAGLRALDAEFGQPVMFSTEEVRGEPLTHARVAQILAAIREELESRRGSTPPPAGGTPRKRPNGPGGGQQLAAAW